MVADGEADEQRVAGVEAGLEEDLAHADDARERVGREHGDNACEAEAGVEHRDAEEQEAHDAALEEEDLGVTAEDGVEEGVHLAAKGRKERRDGKAETFNFQLRTLGERAAARAGVNETGFGL